MWIARVIARAFGPFSDEALELAPGMNVVVGPNEAGKSTWHAATRLALTGLRRGRGRATAAEAALEARHRPWDAAERWEVEARLLLADGRQIDISQDLANKVACRAVDVDLGRDVSDEILDGTPDASRWLGLDRDAFAATVSVSQAQIMAVADADAAAQLQEFMQRAAATRGTDATAAEAIERLTEFRRAAVGADRVSAKGPLRVARTNLEAARAELDEARRRHAAYLEQAAAAEAATEGVAQARLALAAAEAANARQRAERARARLERAEGLAARHPRPPAGVAARDERADTVVAALEAWQRRPHPAPLSGPTGAELEAALAELPATLDGDRRPDPSVLASARALDVAQAALRTHDAAAEPAHPAQPDAGRAPSPSRRSAGMAWLVVAAALAGGGLLAAILAQPAVAVALVVAGAGAGVLAWRSTEQAGRREREARAANEIRARLEEERREASMRRREELGGEEARARASLSAALTARGQSVTDDLGAALDEYLAGCDARAALAERAAGRASLERELAARRASEAAAAEATAAARASEDALRNAVRETGGDATLPAPRLVELLEAWRGARRLEAERAERALAEWQELRAILDGASLDELRAETAGLAAAADRRAAALTGAPALPGAVDDALLTRRRAELATAGQLAADLAGGLRVLQAALPDVAEAEERVAAAERELRRVEALATTVDLTLRLLQSAQERVHRDLAPILAESVRRWLPAVSGGAYVEASVDPADLSVRVKEADGGQWRDARLLSEGTREQVYLLLRVAMAEHLVRPGEVAPLLLDEVTAQADAPRTRELLAVLHALSAERQVILFSHDEVVADWASASLREPRDRLIRLAPRAGRAVPTPGGAEEHAALSIR